MIAMRLGLCVLLILTTAASVLAGVVVIDPMTVEFLPNNCLPVTTPRVATWGAWCDAPSCPPGTVTPDTDCQAGDQPDFGSDLIGPARTTQVWGREFSTSVSVSVDPIARRMVCVTSGGFAATLDVMYADSETDAWEGDLAALGATAVEAVVDGPVSPSEPVFLQLHVLTRGDAPGGVNGGQLESSNIRIESPGRYRIPFESLTQWPPEWPYPANFHRVTLLWFRLSQCPDLRCDGPGFPAGTFTLGPLTLTTAEPTTALRRTWAQVKQSYR